MLRVQSEIPRFARNDTLREGFSAGSADLVFSEVCGFSAGNVGRAADLQKQASLRYALPVVAPQIMQR